MSDTAKAPASGYIFQFEKALLELSKLHNSESISIEHIDDIAKLDEKGTVILTIQAKHSISNSGSTFGSTSKDIWRTLELWITKLKDNTLNSETLFICSTNKKITSESILHDFIKHGSDFKKVIDIIKVLKAKQEAKLVSSTKGTSIQKIIDLIDFCLSHPSQLEIIIKNLRIHDEDDVKLQFMSQIHLDSSNSNDLQRDSIYESMCGWLFTKSKEIWKNKKEAIFSKEAFNYKYNLLRDNHTITKAIFRAKGDLEKINPIDYNIKRDDLYIKQIEDIDRDIDDKNFIIKEAINDFILFEIELANLIINNTGLTQKDFEDFENTCMRKWGETKRKIIKHSVSKYNDEELNDLGIEVFNEIMYDLKVKFQDHFGFDDNNKYIQNGCFLKLSNVPSLGWHPDWKKKYTT